MYYFSNFSLYFLLANIVASILVPLIIAMGFLALLLSPFGTIHAWTVKVLGGLVDGICRTATEISGWPLASLSSGEVTPMEVGTCYLLLVGVWTYWKAPSRKTLMGMLVCIICLLAVRLCILLG